MTKSKLVQVIKEEIANILNEDREEMLINMCMQGDESKRQSCVNKVGQQLDDKRAQCVASEAGKKLGIRIGRAYWDAGKDSAQAWMEKGFKKFLENCPQATAGDKAEFFKAYDKAYTAQSEFEGLTYAGQYREE